MSREIELRDAALRIVNARGQVQPPTNAVFWHDHERLLMIMYATPFYRPQDRDWTRNPFPYCVRIYAPDPGANEPDTGNVQVLSVEWNARSGATRIIKYRPGHWEDEIEAIAAETH